MAQPMPAATYLQTSYFVKKKRPVGYDQCSWISVPIELKKRENASGRSSVHLREICDRRILENHLTPSFFFFF